MKQNVDIGILLLRLFIGLRLIYGVIDNVVSWEHMIKFAQFIEANNLPFPIVSAVVSVYAQFIGGLMILIGLKIRWASLLIIINFIVALYVHLNANDTVEGMTPALAMLFGGLVLFFTGSGRISFDSYLNRNNKIISK